MFRPTGAILRRWLKSILSAQPEHNTLSSEEIWEVKKFIAWCLLGVAIVFGAVALSWENKPLRFAIQLVTGNWSTGDAESVGPAWFSLSVILALLLNWLPLIAAFGLIFKFMGPLITEAVDTNKKVERTKMNLAKALSVRTIVQEQQVLSSFPGDPESQKKISDAFNRADELWRDRLTSLIGEQEAKDVFEALERELPMQSPKSGP